jgi:hypothetical protein
MTRPRIGLFTRVGGLVRTIVPARDRLAEVARNSAFRLLRIVPARAVVGDTTRAGRIGLGRLSRICRGWERVFWAESAKIATIRQLGATRGTAWSRIGPPPRRPE